MKITKMETTIIPNTEHGQKFADEYCKKLKVKTAFVSRATGKDGIIVYARYTLSVKEPAEYKCKCGSCKWLDAENKRIIGYRCTNPDKVWRTEYGMYKQKSIPACKMYEEVEE